MTRLKTIPAKCNECKKDTTVLSKSGNAFYAIPNCKHHGEIK